MYIQVKRILSVIIAATLTVQGGAGLYPCGYTALAGEDAAFFAADVGVPGAGDESAYAVSAVMQDEEHSVKEEVSADSAPYDVCDEDQDAADTASDDPAALASDDTGSDTSSRLGMVPGVDYSADTVIAGADDYPEAAGIARAYGAEIVSFDHGIVKLSVSKNSTSDEVLDRYAASRGGLPKIEPNFYTRLCDYNDPYLSSDSDSYQWMHGEEFLSTEKAWNITKGRGVTVAVIDTGVNRLEDFGDRLLEGVNAVESVVTNDTTDQSGHGTHVAGIIAAGLGDGIGGAGVAPQAEIYPIKVFYKDKNGDYVSDAVSTVRGIYEAIEKKVDIINFSASSCGMSDAEKKAWDMAIKAGIVVVAAAGNGYTDAVYYPAERKDIISVAAIDSNMKLAEYSNFGSTVNLAAPGSAIWSTVGEDTENYKSYLKQGRARDGYCMMNGTSMAAPVVAGTAALVLSCAGTDFGSGKKRVAAVRNILLGAVHDVTHYKSYYGRGNYVGDNGDGVYGSVDAYSAVSLAVSGGKVEKPEISVSETGSGAKVTISCATDGADIYYTTDGEKPDAVTGTLYEGAFDPELSGTHTIKAVAVIGRKKGGIASLKHTFDAPPGSVSLNGGRTIYVTAGGKARIVPEFKPAGSVAKLEYSIEGTGFSVDQKGVVSCDPSTPAGTKARLTAKGEGNLKAQAVLTAKSSSADIITMPDSISLVAVENDETRAQKYSVSADLLPLIRSNDEKTDYVIISSKPSVVRVEGNRYIRAVSKGKAVISVIANDGSGKKTKCKVSVIMPAMMINAVKTSTGFINYSDTSGDDTIVDLFFDRDSLTDRHIDRIPIARGGKMKLYAYMNDDCSWKYRGSGSKRTAPTNKRVDYRITGSGASRVYVKNGILYCRDNASVGKTFTVTLTAADGFGASRSVDFRIYENPGDYGFKAPAYRIRGAGIIYESSFEVGDVSGKGFLTENLKVNENSRGLYAVVCDKKMISRSMIKRQSSDGSGSVMTYIYQFPRSGQTKLTCKTRDGSGKTYSTVIEIMVSEE